MEDSILKTIKKLLGLLQDDTSFDLDITTHINSVLSLLRQIGFTIADNFMVTSEAATWSELVGSVKHLDLVRTYIYLRVRLLFDPPTSSFGLDSMQKQAAEFEWRLHVLTDPPFVSTITVVEPDPTF